MERELDILQGINATDVADELTDAELESVVGGKQPTPPGRPGRPRPR